MTKEKACTKCGITKRREMFSRQAAKRDGLRCFCKACQSSAKAKYYATHKTHVLASCAKWAAANREKGRAYCANYYRANTERVKAQKAAWQAANPDKLNAAGARRRARKLGAAESPIPAEFSRWMREQAAACRLLTGLPFDLDHILPLSRGGAHCTENLRLLPSWLNNLKRAKLDSEVTSADFHDWINARGDSFELRITWENT